MTAFYFHALSLHSLASPYHAISGSQVQAEGWRVLNHMLCINAERNRGNRTVSISQSAYIARVPKRFRLEDCTPASAPLPPGTKLSDLNPPFHELLGSLMYLYIKTRPDLSFAIQPLSRYQADTGRALWDAGPHLLRYLKGVIDLKVTYSVDSPLTPVGYADAGHCGCLDTGRSTPGYVFLASGGPVCWSLIRQQRLSTSNTEAECKPLCHAGQMALWIDNFLSEIGVNIDRPLVIHTVNKGALDISKHATQHGHDYGFLHHRSPSPCEGYIAARSNSVSGLQQTRIRPRALAAQKRAEFEAISILHKQHVDMVNTTIDRTNQLLQVFGVNQDGPVACPSRRFAATDVDGGGSRRKQSGQKN